MPLIAALLHYQVVTIHPYYDGNGRTARRLATFELHRSGYGLNGFFALEERHARDLDAYYGALVTDPTGCGGYRELYLTQIASRVPQGIIRARDKNNTIS